MPRKQYTFTMWQFTWYFKPSPHVRDNFEKKIKEDFPLFINLWNRLDSISSDEDVNRVDLDSYLYHVQVQPQSNIRFIVAQIEKCPSTDRYHFQGHVVFGTSTCRKACLRALAMPTVHIEPCHSDSQTNINYCSKAKTSLCRYVAHGTPPAGRGYRSDLVAVYELALQLATGKEMLQTLGSAGMRHLPLYQRTVRVLMDDDYEDQRILEVRAQRSRALRDSLSHFSVHGGFMPDSDNDHPSDTDLDHEDSPSPAARSDAE